MASIAQIAANRENARKSTGPRTAEGKQSVRLNAFRHGLTAQVCVMPQEDREAYDAFHQELVASLLPANPVERHLAASIADLQWRIHHCRTLECNLLALGHAEEAAGLECGGHPQVQAALGAARTFRDNTTAFHTLSLYEQRLFRSYMAALKQLHALQTERAQHEARQLPVAARLQSLNASKGLPYNPIEDGFVFSTSRLDAWSDRTSREEQARLLQKRRDRRRDDAWQQPPIDLHPQNASSRTS